MFNKKISDVCVQTVLKTTSTSTVSTTTVCYVTSGTLAACGKRRRRYVVEEIEPDVKISPSRPVNDIESSLALQGEEV